MRKIFLAAVLGVAAIAGTFICASKKSASATAGLTEGEKAEVRKIFGDSVNTEVVWLVEGPCMSDTAAMQAFANLIVICKEEYASRDYSKEENILKYGDFMHEITHVWQFQNYSPRTMAFCKTYKYSLDDTHKFSDYCIEQQGDIVLDYARRFLFKGECPTSSSHENTPENDLLLQKLVEDQFPAARESRLAMQEGKESLNEGKPPASCSPKGASENDPFLQKLADDLKQKLSDIKIGAGL